MRGRSLLVFAPLTVALLATVAVTQPAAAAPACYSKAEFEAEQGLRLHSEMMVTALKCHKDFKDRDPFGAYSGFSRSNKGTIGQWERAMIGYFRRSGESQPVRALDDLRTTLANEYATLANDYSADYYCNERLGWLSESAGMTRKPLSAYLTKISPDTPVRQTLCPKVKETILSAQAKLAAQEAKEQALADAKAAKGPVVAAASGAVPSTSAAAAAATVAAAPRAATPVATPKPTTPVKPAVAQVATSKAPAAAAARTTTKPTPGRPTATPAKSGKEGTKPVASHGSGKPVAAAAKPKPVAAVGASRTTAEAATRKVRQVAQR